MYDPSLTITIIKKCAELFQGLRKRQNDKETFDMVRDLQAEQSNLETQIKEAESEMTRLNGLITDLKRDYADEIAKLKKEHAAEIAQFKAAADYAQREGFSSSGGNRVGTPPGF
jgi:predicted  nucleic acid-binding Zn-ribbon protein